MPLQFLDFEQPIAELEAKIEELRFLGGDAQLDAAEEIEKRRAKSRALTASIFGSLTPWQITQLARHPQRPYTLDYIPLLFTEFQELPKPSISRSGQEGIVWNGQGPQTSQRICLSEAALESGMGEK